MPFKIGAFARILGTRPEQILGILVLVDQCAVRGLDLTLGHGMDGEHSRASLHYAGAGDDFQITGFQNNTAKLKFEEDVRPCLGQDFDFLLEDLGKPNEHWHVEFQPKSPY